MKIKIVFMHRKIGISIVLWLEMTIIGYTQQIDSLTFAGAKWKSKTVTTGVVCHTLSIDLFDAPQKLYYVEVDTAYNRVVIDQFEWLDKIKSVITKSNRNIVAAVNGGFFDTKTKRAVPVHFIKTRGILHNRKWGGAAVAVGKDDRITFENWNGKDSLWQASFEEVMVAGPMLLLNGKNFFPELNNSGGRHPRSCIGIRKDGSVILLVIDGRRKKAAGMSFSELAKVCLWLKMESALNLDGGGSSSLWVKNKKTVNRPSDGIAFIHRDRKVCNMISVESKDKNE